MTWNGERRARLPANWNALVKKVWERDKGQCTWRLPKTGNRCPRPGADVDHRKNDDDHRLSNLQLLCRTHHDQKTQREARFGRARPKLKKREQAPHPGLIR